MSRRAAAAGPTRAATASRVPRPWAATRTAPASRTRTASVGQDGGAPRSAAVARSKPAASSRQCRSQERGDDRAGERRRRGSGRRRTAPRMSPKSRVWIPGGEAGESASRAPRPNNVVTTTATAASRPIPGARPTRAIASAAIAIAGDATDQQRHAGKGGQDQARERARGQATPPRRRRRRGPPSSRAPRRPAEISAISAGPGA